MLRPLILLYFSFLLAVSSTSIKLNAESSWTDIIRKLPYEHSLHLHRNLTDIRRWVLFQKSYCENADRHILFNSRGRFLGYINNLETSQATQAKLNQTRESLFKQNKVKHWVAGDQNRFGYPFALNCNQPHVDISRATARLLGEDQADRLWGTWDGMRAGTSEQPIPLYQLVELVYKTKSKIIGEPVIADEYRLFLAQIIIESGARKDSLSKDNAIGLLQLKPSVLKDCKLEQKFYRHRMAQVDCAVRLYQQNQRNLRPAFESIFGHLEKSKQSRLFSLLLVQSYHSGIGRIQRLLTDPTVNQASLFFAQKHRLFSASDIATGIIFHNAGRENLGFASLYYLIDISITAAQLCQTQTLQSQWFCSK
ncbi:hypothetical protein ACUR5C_07810 [Aliikangiella sp. IMCC44653]